MEKTVSRYEPLFLKCQIFFRVLYFSSWSPKTQPRLATCAAVKVIADCHYDNTDRVSIGSLKPGRRCCHERYARHDVKVPFVTSQRITDFLARLLKRGASEILASLVPCLLEYTGKSDFFFSCVKRHLSTVFYFCQPRRKSNTTSPVLISLISIADRSDSVYYATGTKGS